MDSTMLVDQFPQLTPGHVYADWTGAALPPVSLIDEWHNHLRSTLLGNPHSHHQPSVEALREIQTTRKAVRDYFHADPTEYEVIFTTGATAAIRLLEHYRFEGGELLLTADNHNSVNGLRETAKRAGAVVRYSPIQDDLSLDQDALERLLAFPRSNGNKLFCYPAKSNYAGVLHDLSWVPRARERGWDVLLDAAAYVSNQRLDLSMVKPDFVPMSFYKMFGFPTGVGCMLVRREAYKKLHKKWFAGGSILLVAVMKDFFAPESLGYARFEDGTVNFAQIGAVRSGLKFLSTLGDTHCHARALACRLRNQLIELHDGANSITMHSPPGTDIVTFSVKKGDSIVDAWVFEKAANEQGVFVRTGCFCNPGVNEKVFGYTVDAYERLYNDAILPDAITIEKLREFSDGKPIGAIRASFGYANTVQDVDRFIEVTRDILRHL